LKKLIIRTTQIILGNINDDLLIGKALWSEVQKEIQILVFYLSSSNKEKIDNLILDIRKLIQWIKDLGYETIASNFNKELEELLESDK